VDDSAVAIKKLPEMLYAAAFSPDGRYIAAGGCGTNEGKIFDTQDEFKVLAKPAVLCCAHELPPIVWQHANICIWFNTH